MQVNVLRRGSTQSFNEQLNRKERETKQDMSYTHSEEKEERDGDKVLNQASITISPLILLFTGIIDPRSMIRVGDRLIDCL